MKDVVDEIDRLVDESLARGPIDDYEVNRYDKCPHCGRDFHGIAITQKIADMWRHGIYDEDYSVADDSSEILCNGSLFIGPMRAKPVGRFDTYGGLYSWVQRLVSWPENQINHTVSVRIGDGTTTQHRWWRMQLPDNGRYRHDHMSNTIIIVIDGNEQEFIADYVRIDHERDEVMTLQSETPTRVHETVTVDVRQEHMPTIGTGWVPLGTVHPDYYTTTGVTFSTNPTYAPAPQPVVTYYDEAYQMLEDGIQFVNNDDNE